MAFKYPIDLNESTTDYITFNHFEWKLNRKLGGSQVGTYSDRFMSDPPAEGAPIVLYVPNSLPSMGQQQNYLNDTAPGELGQIKRQISSAAAGVGYSDDPGKAGAAAADAALETLKNGVGAVAGAGRQFAIEAIAQEIGANPNTIIALGSGKILNPNIEVVYQGPTLRSFGFSFTFAPKDSEESKAIKDIIYEFKRWSAPEGPTQSGGMLKVPHVWRVKYGGKFAKKANPFKRAVLQSVDVDYNAGLNTHMTFDDGEPVLIGLSLSFQENDYITRDDHAQAKNAGFMGGF